MNSGILHRIYIAVVIAVAMPPALVAENICDDLSAQLKPTVSVYGDSQSREFSIQINIQNRIIREIRTEMRRTRCSIGSVIVIGNQNASLCSSLGDQLVEARNYLDQLNKQRNSSLIRTDNYENRLSKSEIWNSLDEHGCNIDDEETPIKEDEPTSINKQVQIISPSHDTAGDLRTMCVRTCDGKFFPIGSNASPLDFNNHETKCQSLCPNTQIELYYHHMHNQESADMISIDTGRAYSKLPTAYAFQNSTSNDIRASCGCTTQTENIDGIDGNTDLQSSVTTVPAIQTSSPTQANESALSPANEDKIIVDNSFNEERPYDPTTTKVRVVGPQFLPDSSSSIDLKNPL